MRLISYPEFCSRLHNLLMDGVNLANASKDMLFYDKKKEEFICPGTNRKFDRSVRKSDVEHFVRYACDVVTIYKLFRDKVIQINGDHEEFITRCVPALESVTSEDYAKLVEQIEFCSSQWQARLLAGKYDNK